MRRINYVQPKYPNMILQLANEALSIVALIRTTYVQSSVDESRAFSKCKKSGFLHAILSSKEFVLKTSKVKQATCIEVVLLHSHAWNLN